MAVSSLIKILDPGLMRKWGWSRYSFYGCGIRKARKKKKKRQDLRIKLGDMFRALVHIWVQSLAL